MRMIQISLLFLFIFFISIPTIQYFYPFIHVNPVNEHRMLADWPKENPWRGLKDGSEYPFSIEQFFSDHFPLRDAMLRSLGQFEYTVLNRSREIIVGKNGWLSDKKVLTEQLHQLDQVTDDQIQAAIIQIKQLQYWLENKGVTFLVVIVPMKPTVYAEKFPKFYNRPEKIGLNRFQDAMKRNNIPYIDVLSILKTHKQETQLYYKTDMHWNTAGASYIAQAIIDYLSNNTLGRFIWNENIEKYKQPFSGEELNAMPLLFPKPEDTPLWISNKTSYENKIAQNSVAPVEIFFGTDKNRAQLPPSIMFGNSFMLSYPGTGYHNYFTESTRVLDYQYFSRVLDFIKPKHKIFILHIYETQLLFHILPPDNFGYWDKRIKKLPLPNDYAYK